MQNIQAPKDALILYNEQTSEIANTLFDKKQSFLLRNLPGFPICSLSSSSATLTIGTKGLFSYALISNVRKTGLHPYESAFVALLLKKIGVLSAFTLIMTGITVML